MLWNAVAVNTLDPPSILGGGPQLMAVMYGN